MFRRIGEVLMAPRKGQPPIPPEGYEALPFNKFMYVLKIPSCIYRSYSIKKSSCCDYEVMNCSIKNKIVTRSTCHECNEFKSE